MLKNISKKFMLFSMIFILNNSVIGTIAYANEQTNTLSSSTNSTDSSGTSDKILENKDSVTTVSDKKVNKDDKLESKLADKENQSLEKFGIVHRSRIFFILINCGTICWKI